MITRSVFLVLLIAFTSVTYAASNEKTGALQTVVQLYRDFSWEAVINEPELADHDLIEQPRKILERYFDSNISGLILKDRKCAAQSQEICNLDFSPIWASQDPGASELKVIATSDPNIVKVSFRYPGNGDMLNLTYHLVKTSAGWRISDIVYASGNSLLSILSVKR